MTLNLGVAIPVIMMIQMPWYMPLSTLNINAPVPPKWKHNDHILEEYKKFHHSCQRIFDGPMAYVTSGKVKTNMFSIWYGQDREDIYDNFELTEDEMYDIDYVMEQFELYCEPICNFCAARYKFHQVSQRENEMTNTIIAYKNSVYNASSVMTKYI